MKETITRTPLKTNASSSSPTPNPASSTHDLGSSPTANASKFWAYFTFGISLCTLLMLTLSASTPQDDESWFLSLPADLKHHYSKGRMIKVLKSPYNAFPFQVFAIESDSPRNEGEETVLLIHGFGCNSYSFRSVIKSIGLNGIHAVGLDFPGSGFSDKSEFVVKYERLGRIFGWFSDIYSDLRKKGWTLTKILKPMDLDSEDVGTIIGQVIYSLDLSSPVHIVLHDFALVMCASWTSWNLEVVRSITLIDSTPASTAFPLRMLEMPVVRDVVLGFSFAYQGLLRNCCSRSVNRTVAEAHRVLLTDGLDGSIGGFDLGDWADFMEEDSVPIQVLWSRNWSEEWTIEGSWVARGRWPREDAADEIAETITNFVASLPKYVKIVMEEPLPDHIRKVFEGKGSIYQPDIFLSPWLYW
ncbi:hypothetical protein MKW98_008086 [Papaver atlanticum]|uniref:AB hydrolase-1 domain-containing protein n=1 Tax=Papaver atlanticum TaxID=357466 RepID=A0AAD4S7Q8_9MAGN|nr:hypothetical protein MKW98_008086 [Papaver atlanticum]